MGLYDYDARWYDPGDRPVPERGPLGLRRRRPEPLPRRRQQPLQLHRPHRPHGFVPLHPHTTSSRDRTAAHDFPQRGPARRPWPTPTSPCRTDGPTRRRRAGHGRPAEAQSRESPGRGAAERTEIDAETQPDFAPLAGSRRIGPLAVLRRGSASPSGVPLFSAAAGGDRPGAGARPSARPARRWPASTVPGGSRPGAGRPFREPCPERRAWAGMRVGRHWRRNLKLVGTGYCQCLGRFGLDGSLRTRSFRGGPGSTTTTPASTTP